VQKEDSSPRASEQFGSSVTEVEYKARLEVHGSSDKDGDPKMLRVDMGYPSKLVSLIVSCNYWAGRQLVNQLVS
jgi:hypothetical protein